MIVRLVLRDGVSALNVDLPAFDCDPEVVWWNGRSFVARESRDGQLAYVETISLSLDVPAGAHA